MARLTSINDLLFPVEAHPVYANIKMQAGERHISVPDKKALINMKTGRVVYDGPANDE